VSGNLQTRIVTGMLLVAALVVVMFWMPPRATLVVLTGLVLVGAWEWSAFLRSASALVRVLYVVLIAALLYFIWRFTTGPDELHSVLAVTVAWWIIAFVWIVLAPRRVAPWSAAVAGIFALVPAWLSLAYLRLDSIHGAEWVLFVFLLVWMADIGGYIFGRRYGRLRLAPKVSPAKTWEGAFGGFALSGLIGIGGAGWFHLPLERFLPLCLAVVAFSIVGDLTESLLKRYVGVKDSGTLFPGHGGVMDRIDSITAAAPVLVFGLVMLRVIE
jgi:phosphatidate cytidylyltransferase